MPRTATALRQRIKRNLQKFVQKTGGYYRLYSGKDALFAEGTVKNWSGGRESIPSLEQAAMLADHTRLSLDWLATGEGPEFRGAPAPVSDTAAALRQTLVSLLTTGSNMTRAEVDGALPPAADFLDRLVAEQREKVLSAVRERRRAKRQGFVQSVVAMLREAGTAEAELAAETLRHTEFGDNQGPIEVTLSPRMSSHNEVQAVIDAKRSKDTRFGELLRKFPDVNDEERAELSRYIEFLRDPKPIVEFVSKPSIDSELRIAVLPPMGSRGE